MSIALYRKYRPKTFAEVTNQNHIKVTLQNELMTDKLAHAYLFCGPRGTGKTTMARLIAKAANCVDRKAQGEPCNACVSCQEIMAGKALDLIEVDAASHTGVDNVRDNIINNARFTPSSALYKIFIIDEVHMLSTSAFNALLKILEEPPKHVMFILATTEVHKVPVTILSRCQRFDFRKINVTELKQRLQWIVTQEQAKVNDDVLELIAKQAGGCVRDAESLLEQLLSLGTEITREQATLIIPQTNTGLLVEIGEALIQKNSPRAIELVNTFVDEGGNVGLLIDNLVEWLRQVMVYRLTNQLTVLSAEMEDSTVQRVVGMVANVSPLALAHMIEVILEKKQQFRNSPIAQLPLEVAIVALTSEEPVVVLKPTPIAPSAAPTPPLTPPRGGEGNSLPPTPATVDNSVEKRNNVAGASVQTPSFSIESVAPPVSSAAMDPAVKSTAGITLTFNQVVHRWPAVLQAIKIRNYALGMSLSVAKPVGLTGNQLTLGYLFELQKSRVESPANSQVLHEVVAQEFGVALELRHVIDASLTLHDVTPGTNQSSPAAVVVEQQETTDPVSQAMNVFGGSLVDGVG